MKLQDLSCIQIETKIRACGKKNHGKLLFLGLWISFSQLSEKEKGRAIEKQSFFLLGICFIVLVNYIAYMRNVASKGLIFKL